MILPVVEHAGQGRIYAVGGGVALPSALPWLPSERGWSPFQVYVFVSNGEATLLDTGLAVHRETIAADLAKLLPIGGLRQCIVSRWEPDAMINLPWLIERYEVNRVFSVDLLNPLDFFTAFEGAMQDAGAQAMTRGAVLDPIAPGSVVRTGPFEIECLATTLKLLLTNWFYESATGTLFTSDSFGFIVNPDRPEPFFATLPDVTPRQMAKALHRKFEWLTGAACAPLADDLRRLRVDRTINRICPMYGGLIEGADAVRMTFEVTEAALLLLAAESQNSPVEGFDWEAAVSQDAVIAIDDLSVPLAPKTTAATS